MKVRSDQSQSTPQSSVGKLKTARAGDNKVFIHYIFESKKRRRRPWLIMAPVCSLFLWLGLLLLWPNDSGIDNTVPGVITTGLGLVLVGCCLYFGITAKEKSGTLRRLEAMPRVPNKFVRLPDAHTAAVGNRIAVIAADTLYISKALTPVMIATYSRAVSDEMFVSLFEMLTSMKRYFRSFALGDIQSVETWEQTLVISTADEIAEFPSLGSATGAKELASLALPGVVGVTKIHENERNKGGVSTTFNPDVERLIFRRSNATNSITPEFEGFSELQKSEWSTMVNNSIGDRPPIDRVAVQLGNPSLKRRWRPILGYLLAIFASTYISGVFGMAVIRDFGPAETADAVVYATRVEGSTESPNYESFLEAENGKLFKFRSQELFNAYSDHQPDREMPVTLEYSTVTGGPREVRTESEMFRRPLIDTIALGVFLLVGLAATSVMLLIVAKASYRRLAFPVLAFLIPVALWLAWLSWV